MFLVCSTVVRSAAFSPNISSRNTTSCISRLPNLKYASVLLVVMFFPFRDYSPSLLASFSRDGHIGFPLANNCMDLRGITII